MSNVEVDVALSLSDLRNRIEVVLELDGVGENFQDHTAISVSDAELRKMVLTTTTDELEIE